MAPARSGPLVRVASADDVPAIAELRALWSGAPCDAAFRRDVAEWLEADGDRRTVWLAERDGGAVGIASLFEYRRMPKPGSPPSRWGYVSNVFVREESRGRGIGTALLGAVTATADERGYARVVVSPAERALPLYRRAGFVIPGEAGSSRLLVRSAHPASAP